MNFKLNFWGKKKSNNKRQNGASVKENDIEDLIDVNFRMAKEEYQSNI